MGRRRIQPKVEEDAWQEELDALFRKLDDGNVIYFPIRHHSPACAWHLRSLIRERRPASILVEGPESLDSFIPFLTDPETRPPVALFTQFVDRKGLTVPVDDPRPKTPPRFGAYYPLCDYSPELVALREGQAVGARLSFIDLDHSLQVLAENRSENLEPKRARSLMDERHLTRSAYLQALARRRGCRDTDELWDRLFEADFLGEDELSFRRNVAAYCWIARHHTSEESLRLDGTLMREKRMQERISAEVNHLRRRAAGPLLVVTGGFHTPALVLGNAAAKRAERPQHVPEEGDVIQAIIPYSFQQLDALRGYAAGMPSPRYYQLLWERSGSGPGEALRTLCLEILTDLPRQTRRAGLPSPLSTADAIAAYHQALMVARFRGNPGPLREDVLDGIRSSFVKGELDMDGGFILQMALEMLRGDSVGHVSGKAPRHPIVIDFRRRAEALSLRLESTTDREAALDIYNNDRHRRISRLFHQTDFLGIPFARFAGGPDFLTGKNLDLRIEHWNWAWTPQTESRLIEVSMFGATLDDAVVVRLHEQLERLQQEGGDAGAPEAVSLLALCCLLGLQQHLGEFVAAVRAKLAGEADFAEAVQATLQLDVLSRYQGPLESDSLSALPPLVEAGFHRCCHLAGNLALCKEDQVPGALEALANLRDLLVRTEASGERLDTDLFWDVARASLGNSQLDPTLRGGFTGLLFSSGKMDRQGLLNKIQGSVLSTDRSGNTAPRFLQGLFTLCREITWQDAAVLKEINAAFAAWDDDDFQRALPFLRLAFAQHTPRETDRVASLVSSVNEGADFGSWYHRDLDEELLYETTRAATVALKSLEEDNLLTFLADESTQ
jgi:hypothetical protein